MGKIGDFRFSEWETREAKRQGMRECAGCGSLYWPSDPEWYYCELCSDGKERPAVPVEGDDAVHAL